MSYQLALKTRNELTASDSKIISVSARIAAFEFNAVDRSDIIDINLITVFDSSFLL